MSLFKTLDASHIVEQAKFGSYTIAVDYNGVKALSQELDRRMFANVRLPVQDARSAIEMQVLKEQMERKLEELRRWQFGQLVPALLGARETISPASKPAPIEQQVGHPLFGKF